MELCLSVSRSVSTLGLLLISAAMQQVTAQTKPGAQPDLATRIQDGAGREVKFANSGDSAENTYAAIQSMANFIYRRSGVLLDSEVQSRLAAMEQRAVYGVAPRVTPSRLGAILADLTSRRLKTMAGTEMDQVFESLRGFNSPDLPLEFQRGRTNIKTRASAVVSNDVGAAKLAALAVRAGAGADTFGASLGAAANTDIEQRVRSLAGALPVAFGAASYGMTPAQAVLVAYSAAADDLLADSSAALRSRMANLQSGLTQMTRQSYPSPEGHFAYGSNGYLFAAPVNVIFEKSTLNELLNQLEK